MRIKVVILAIILSALNLSNSYAKDLYAECIKGFDFGSGTGQEVVEVHAFSGSCAKSCDAECKSLSRKMDPRDERSIELNADLIQQCTHNCRIGQSGLSGQGIEYYIRENIGTTTNPNIKFVGPYRTLVSCDVSSDQFTNSHLPQNNTKTKLSVAQGDQISISYVSSANEAVYLCGKQKLKLTPTINSISKAAWDNSTNLNAVIGKTGSMCTSYMDDATFNSLTNKKLWQNYKDPSDQLCGWHARNPNYTNTGIYPKNGDELTISFTGKYAYGYNIDGQEWDNKKAFEILSDTNADPADKTTAEIVWKDVSTIYVKPADQTNNTGAAGLPIIGEEARKDVEDKSELESVGFTSSCNPDDATSYRPFGLYGCALDTYVRYRVDSSDEDCDTDEKANYNALKCKTTTDPGIPKYIFSGTLSDYSGSHSELALKHFELPANNFATLENNHSDNVGGYEVEIDYGGCPFRGGERLEYTIYNPPPPGGNTTDTFDWDRIPDDVLSGSTPLIANKSGYLFFRIKPLSPPSSAPGNVDDLYGPSGRYGKYDIVVNKLNDSGFLNKDGPIKNTVSTVYKTLFFSDNVRQGTISVLGLTIPYTFVDTETRGAVGALYEGIIQQNRFIQMIRAFLVLYVTFLGIGFIMGVIQTNQKELVVRSFKIAVVLALISETSWEFFSDNFFSLFIFGGVQLISYVATGGLGNILPFSPEVLAQDPSLIFVTFDGIFTQIFSANVWKKIGAYLLTGVMGLVTSIFIIISLFMYMFAIIKAVLIYLMSLVMIAMLIVIAPVMIPMMLFKVTNQYFTTWWQMLLSFTLQPVAVFASISIFNILISIAIYSALSSTICPKCYFSIAIPAYKSVCILPWYQMMISAHTPDGQSAFSFPSGIFIASLILLILVHAMISFVEFSSKLVSALITGDISDRGQSLEGYTGRANRLAGSGIRNTVPKVAAAGAYTAGRTKLAAQGTYKRLK